VKECGRKELQIYKSISEELDGNSQLHASASLALEKQLLAPSDSRWDPDLLRRRDNLLLCQE
jgi:hypothetical protein